MRPYPEEILRAIQMGIGAHFGPEVESTYGKAQLAFAMLLFGVAMRDYDTAVPDLLENNNTLRALLTDAGAALAQVDAAAASTALAQIEGADLAAARDAVAAIPPPAGSLRLSALRAENDALRGTISKLVPLLEACKDVDALAPLRSSRAAIYAYLSADAKKRVVPILSA